MPVLDEPNHALLSMRGFSSTEKIRTALKRNQFPSLLVRMLAPHVPLRQLPVVSGMLHHSEQ
ncbi:hypothetical protein G6045_06065 [Streptomyces sp. YC504]|uniref:Uncharacterized protein n=1 Tax=Streptomyces mesophilus TaxID=1775132 RepID=A0A6G4XCG6_9ACTN|nr:hypothetical protein [Streptomyces mesophilus]NGO75246.1 hypothetical protein [Streptomyces mesophilus]